MIYLGINFLIHLISSQRLTEVQGQSSEDRGAAKRLSEAYQERETELNAMKNRLEEAEEKKRAAQATLDSAYKLVNGRLSRF